MSIEKALQAVALQQKLRLRNKYIESVEKSTKKSASTEALAKKFKKI